jgi:hypothetical protein
MNNLERITKTVEVGQLNWYGRNDVVYLLSIIEQSQGDENNNAFWKLYDRFEDKIAEKLALRSKLEQAEKALEQIVKYPNTEMQSPEDLGYTYQTIAEEALKAIRGN